MTPIRRMRRRGPGSERRPLIPSIVKGIGGVVPDPVIHQDVLLSVEAEYDPEVADVFKKGFRPCV